LTTTAAVTTTFADAAMIAGAPVDVASIYASTPRNVTTSCLTGCVIITTIT
jgi:hypothetical protein